MIKAFLIHLIARVVIQMIGWSGCQTTREEIHLTEKGCVMPVAFVFGRMMLLNYRC